MLSIVKSSHRGLRGQSLRPALREPCRGQRLPLFHRPTEHSSPRKISYISSSPLRTHPLKLLSNVALVLHRCLFATAVCAFGLSGADAQTLVSAASPPAAFVGATKCGACHLNELKSWTGSHHQLAMQPPTKTTVLGDFNNRTFVNQGVKSTFYRKAGRFMVRTDGPDGALHDYEIKFTYGVFPLQQYLIAMPGGRLQALGIAWDSRSNKYGDQRWFFLYPGQRIPASDPLHWTGIDQTWNYMCADCHSTSLRKNYDAQERTYSTAYAE